MDFSTLQSYVIYMRYKRSGSALLANLLDAHPNIIFPRSEQLFGKYKRWGKDRMFEHLYNTAKRYQDRPYSANGYSYSIEGVGHCERPLVIGHKSSTREFLPLCEDPAKLDEFYRHVSLPLKFVHLMRNPYNMVEARWQQKEFRRSKAPLDGIISHLEDVVKALSNLYKYVNPDDYHPIYLENLIGQTETIMIGLCNFLGVPVTQDYLAKCRKLVFEKEDSDTWTKPSWTADNLRRIDALIKTYPQFFEFYR